jgi:hypothetical protein
MEFTLKYRGVLPGGSASGKVEYEHSIRLLRAVHPASRRQDESASITWDAVNNPLPNTQ